MAKKFVVKSIRALLELSLGFYLAPNTFFTVEFLICCLNIAILLLRLIDAFYHLFYTRKPFSPLSLEFLYFFLLCFHIPCYFPRLVICRMSNKRYNFSNEFTNFHYFFITLNYKKKKIESICKLHRVFLKQTTNNTKSYAYFLCFVQLFNCKR